MVGQPWDTRVLCAICGAKGEWHRGSDGLCPPLTGKTWGSAKPFPKWPKTIKDEAKARALYDKRVATYWKQSRQTHYKPTTYNPY